MNAGFHIRVNPPRARGQAIVSIAEELLQTRRLRCSQDRDQESRNQYLTLGFGAHDFWFAIITLQDEAARTRTLTRCAERQRAAKFMRDHRSTIDAGTQF